MSGNGRTKTSPISTAMAGMTLLASAAVARDLHVSAKHVDGVPDAAQFTTIAAAAKAVAAGDRVLIHNGIYREAVVIKAGGTADAPIRFGPADQIPHVVVTGADALTDWTKEKGPAATDHVQSTPWTHQFVSAEVHAFPGDDQHALIGRVEQVFVNAYPLRQVLAREQLARDTFYVDEASKRLVVWAANNKEVDPKNTSVEASVRPVVWQCDGAYVETRGIDFRYAANKAQQAAVQFAGKGDVVEDCTVEQTSGVGVSFLAPDITARRCVVADNGQLGFGANKADRLHVSDFVVRGNNTKNFNRGWEAGADKICRSRGVVIDHCVFERNNGTGVWFDIANEDCTVSHCLIADNEEGGIFYEISNGLHAHDNVVVGNGWYFSPGGWGAQGGICLSSSPGCTVERNLIVGNHEGFDFREQFRSSPGIDDAKGTPEHATWNHDETVRNNVIAYNQNAQVGGWFDTPDQRHLPKAMQTATAAAPTKRPADDVAGGYGAKATVKQPTGLSLESLNLKFSDNVYAVEDAEPFFNWGPSWAKTKLVLTTVADVQGKLKLDEGSRLMTVRFADPVRRDFRVVGDDPLLKAGYPQGDVPAVRLGSATAEVSDRSR